MNFAVFKDLLKENEREELKYIIFRLDKIVLLPLYVKRVTSSTYFYWCRDLLPQLFETVYNNPVIDIKYSSHRRRDFSFY